MLADERSNVEIGLTSTDWEPLKPNEREVASQLQHLDKWNTLFDETEK